MSGRPARVGRVELSCPVLAASGTAGRSDELAPYVDLASIGAVVVKSMASFAWRGNPPPRIGPVDAGMINAVGLQGKPIGEWIVDDLPRLERRGASVVASVWGFRESEYGSASLELAAVAGRLVAVEVNLSCPNLDHARTMFAHDPMQAASVVATVRAAIPGSLAVWAKLSPNTDRLVEVANAVVEAGAEAVVLVNTVLGMRIDVAGRRPSLGNGGGGLSGAAIRPVAVRSVFDVHAALPRIPIIGVGGVTRAVDAIELMMAGASAVQVGTATFFDPRTLTKVRRGMERWADRNRVRSWAEVVGAAH